MADGTAKVKTLDYKKAPKNVKTILDKKGNIVMTIPLAGKKKYLVITLPKSAVDQKLNSLHASGLGGKLKTKAFIKWINENKDLAVKKYLETKKQNFTFKIALIKGTDITPVPETAEKPKMKPVSGKFKFEIYSNAAKKKGEADFIIPVKVQYSGLTISVKMHVTKEDLSDIRYGKTKKEMEKKAIDAALEEGIPPKQSIGGGSAPIHSDIKKGVRDGLSNAKLQTLGTGTIAKGSGTGKKSEATPTKTVPTKKIGVVTKEAAKDGVKFKNVSATLDLSNVGAGKMKISVNISEKELLASDAQFNKTVDKIVDMAMKEAKKEGFKKEYKTSKFSYLNVKTEIKKTIGPELFQKRKALKKEKKKKIKY